MFSITITDFITIKLCSATLCVSMSITVEQFVEVCSSNGASDAACGIYTYPLNVQAHDCQSILTCAQHLNMYTYAHTEKQAAVPHWYSRSLAFSVLIKTLRLLAPSSTNPMALCSLLLQPNGLLQRLSYFFCSIFFPPFLSQRVWEHLWPFVMNGWGKRGERWMWNITPPGSAGGKKKWENERGRQRRRERMDVGRGEDVCVCAHRGVEGVTAQELHTKAPTCTLPLYLCPDCQACRVCTRVCQCLFARFVYALARGRACVRKAEIG